MLGLLYDLVHLFYPYGCIICGNRLLRNENYLCTACLFELPRTSFQDYTDNIMHRLFWGRVPVCYATALFYFSSSDQYQPLLYQLKYYGHKEIGQIMGKMLGEELLGSSFTEVDAIVPVPLHPRKYRKRGYNQSESIARGIGAILNKPVYTHVLYRAVDTDTQTRKSKYERWRNIQGVFEMHPDMRLTQQHILIVDDVITTGFTLEACALPLLNDPTNKVSLAALAMA